MEGNTNYYYENPNPDLDRQPSPPQNKKNSMATASLILGIASFSFICCGGSIPLGALGIILALLSRVDGPMHNHAKAGMILSSIGFVLSLVVYGITVASLILSGEFSDIMEDYQYFYEYGDEYDNYEIDEDYFNRILEEYQSGGEL